MAVAAAALPSAPAGRLHRLPTAAAASPVFIFPARGLGRRQLSPCGDDGPARHRLIDIPPSQVRIRTRNGGRGREHAVFVNVCAFGFPGGGLELSGRREGGGRVCARPRAVAEAVGGDLGAFENGWEDGVESAGLERLLRRFLRNLLEFRWRRGIPWGSGSAAAIGAVTVVGVLACRSAAVASRCALLGVATFFLFGLLVVDAEKLPRIWEKLRPSYAKARERLRKFGEAASHGAHDCSHKIVASVISSSSSLLAGARREGRNAEDSSSGGGAFIAEAREGVIAARRESGKNSGWKNLVVDSDSRPDVETVVTNISQSVARLMSIVTAGEGTAADVDALSGVKSGIQDLCRQLQSVEASLLAKRSELHSYKPKNVSVEAPVSGGTPGVVVRDFGASEGLERLTASKLVEYGEAEHREMEIGPHCDPSQSDELPLEQRTSNRPLAVKFIPGEEAPSSAEPERVGETLTLSPSVSRTGSVPARSISDEDAAPAADRAVAREFFRAEGLKQIPTARANAEEVVSLLGKSTFTEDGDHSGELFQKFSPAGSSLTEEGSPLSIHSTGNQHENVVLVQKTRSSSPDPWRSNSTTRPIRRKVLTGEYRPAGSSHEWINDDEGQLLDLVLIVDENSKAESPRRDGIGNGKGVHAYGGLDFWGKNAGSIAKTGEQRGALTKRNATGRGSNFGSLDDSEDDRPQERGKMAASDAEQRQFLRRDLPGGSGRAGQPWEGERQPRASGRGAARDGQQLRHDDDSAAAVPDGYGRGEANIRGPQILRHDRDVNVRTNGPLVEQERPADERVSQPRQLADSRRDLLYPDSGGSRYSSERGYEDDGRRESKGGSDGNYGGSNRTWVVPPNPDGRVYSGPEVVTPRNGRSSSPDSAYTPSQSEVTERKLALQESEQSQTVQFERYLDEAEALLEEGMQGLEGRIEVGVAERMLYEAAKLFESASDMQPADLTPVGQWGNTLLVHGELKLKVSQRIRSMLPPPQVSSPFSRGAGVAADRERESMELTLQEVCEECEELLVDAGRKYRRALGLDKTDVRALYNWGLALCYRGQLIAEEGGERAKQDADKVYLAAIDKFEAMLGISQDYTAGDTPALLNWGLAMRDRSRLRAMGETERVQLLLQARELFQDAVRLDPNYGQARGAVAACSAELKELQGFETLQREDVKERPRPNWWQGRG